MEECILCGCDYPLDELVDGICIHCDMDADWMEGYEDWLDEEFDDE